MHALTYEWFSSTDDDLHAADRASRIAMELAPELADAQLARGYTLSNLRRYEEARQHFEAATQINPNLFDAYYYYGRAAFAAGDIEKSIELWQRAAEVRREDFESPLFVAQSLRKLGRDEESRIVNRESHTARRADGRAQSDELACAVAGHGSVATPMASTRVRSNGRGGPKRSIPTTWPFSSTARCCAHSSA